ncbi:Hypothetical protein FKW44_010267 [Caligus rogercresseyi]|uniref:Uncharacterized protein n=1 Tax=Caligus rogercresseyi TaxID=217165 RepID=A0A7T8K784_CALRO|nr:Hypothetical protein FKW44_010267 [Caligus rogercresseyi]
MCKPPRTAWKVLPPPPWSPLPALAGQPPSLPRPSPCFFLELPRKSGAGSVFLSKFPSRGTLPRPSTPPQS